MSDDFSIEQYLSALLPSEKRYLQKIADRTARWKPQSKPQWLAFLSRADELFYGGGAGGGKLLALDTPIPTVTGWKTMGELTVGDVLFDDSGKPTRVVFAFPVDLTPESYRITFDDGSIIYAGADHKWAVQTVAPDGDLDSSAIITTREIYKNMGKNPDTPRYAIKCTKPLELPDAQLPTDPYDFGVLLSKGLVDTQQEITIHPAYLRASISQRADFLHGLLSEYPYGRKLIGDNQCQFATYNYHLAKSLYELVVSLGWKSRITAYDKFWSVDVGCVLEDGGNQKHRSITACERIESVPMRCITVDSPTSLYLAGESMIPTHNSDLILGIAGEAHKNSIIFRRVFPNLRALIERSKEIYNNANSDHSKNSFNESLHVWRLEGGGLLEFGAMQYEKDKSNFQGRPHDFIAFDEAPEFTESQLLFLSAWNRSIDPTQRVRIMLTGNPPLDEAGAWLVRRYAAWLDKKHHHPAKPGELRWYAVVEGKETEIADGQPFIYKGETIYPRSRTFIPALADDNPFYANDGGRYKSVLQSLPEPMRSMLLNGDFEAANKPDPFQVIPTDWVRAAQKRWLDLPKPTTPLTAVGIDPSRGGVDKTSMAKRYDNWFDLVKSWPGVLVKDGALLAEFVRQELGDEEPAYFNIDVSAIGSSGYDHLKPMYKNVIPFNPAEGSEYRDKSKKLKMRNKRAEMYWRMRDALDPIGGDDLALPPSTELLADLCSARYNVTSAGVLIEEKEGIIARIGRSPDEGEAVMMSNFPQPHKGWVRNVG